jgi:hypothetical protein
LALSAPLSIAKLDHSPVKSAPNAGAAGNNDAMFPSSKSSFNCGRMDGCVGEPLVAVGIFPLNSLVSTAIQHLAENMP